MAGEQGESLPGDLRKWLVQKADAQGANPRDVLVRAIAAYRFLEGESDSLDRALDEGFEDAETRVDDLSSRVDDVEASLAAVDDAESALRTDVETLRERLVETRQELESRAPEDHDHPNLERTAREAREAVESTDERVTDLENRLEAGFENYEEVLTYLTETTDDVAERLDTVGSVLTRVRDRTAELEAQCAVRAAADDLRETANRHGERTATCGDCGSTVDLGLLTTPTCPHCGATFEGFEPGPRFFGSATLTVGTRPALEGDVATEGDASLFEGGDDASTDSDDDHPDESTHGDND